MLIFNNPLSSTPPPLPVAPRMWLRSGERQVGYVSKSYGFYGEVCERVCWWRQVSFWDFTVVFLLRLQNPNDPQPLFNLVELLVPSGQIERECFFYIQATFPPQELSAGTRNLWKGSMCFQTQGLGFQERYFIPPKSAYSFWVWNFPKEPEHCGWGFQCLTFLIGQVLIPFYFSHHFQNLQPQTS